MSNAEAEVLAPAEPVTPAAPAAEPVAPVTPAAEPAPWGGPSREEWDRTNMAVSAIVEALQEPEAPVAPEGQPEFAPEVHAFVEEQARKMFEQQVGPYQPLLDEIAREKGQAMVVSELDKLAKGDEGVEGLGEFDRTEAAGRAMLYFQQTGDAHAAIRAAAQAQIEFESRHAQTVLERERQQMQARLDAGTDGAGSGAALPVEGGLKPGYRDKYEQQAAEWAERRKAQGSPVG